MTAFLTLLRLAGPQRSAMIAAIVLRVLEGLTSAVPFGLVLMAAALALDPATAARWPGPSPLTPGGVAVVAGLLVVAYGLQLALFHVAARFGYRAGYRLTAHLRSRLVRHLHDLPSASVQHRGSGDLTALMMSDVTRLELFPGIIMPRLVGAIVLPLIGVVAGLWLDWRLALPLVLAVAVLPAALTGAARLQREASAALTAAHTALNGRLLEVILGMPVIKAFRLTGDRLDRCRAAIDFARDTGKGLTNRYVAAAILVPALVAVAAGATILGAFMLLRQGDITPILFATFVFLALRLFTPVLELVEFSSIIQQMGASAERLMALLSQPAQTVGAGQAVPADTSVRFDEVSLVHADGTRALDRVSFTAPAGGLTALVGQTGAGKTSAARLISRFWDASGGRLSIGGVDIRDIPPDSLADMIGVVSQSVVLFSLSVRDNIRLGRPGADDAAVEAAARAARCHDRIMALPDGYETVLENGGAALSGGERQRLALARLFLKDCPILILDEATSALDVENESLVQAALADLAAGRTVIAIAHRLWTIRHADHIVVLDGGRVAQSGRHDDLIAAGGPYGTLWTSLASAPGWRGHDAQ